MNYEKLYKEALERASHIKDNNTIATPQEVAEFLFPEFKENEDEKTRKAIVKMISDIDGGYPFEKYGIIKKKALAWLEKQGEQKSIEKTKHINHSYTLSNQEFFQWIYDRLVYHHNENPNVDYMISLKERIDDMKALVWGEEDEEMSREVLTDIIYTKNDLKTKGCLELSKRAMKAFNWFSKRHKSLRPQSKWKPSEEQIGALNYAYCELFKRGENGEGSNCVHPLMTLIDDLKKL